MTVRPRLPLALPLCALVAACADAGEPGTTTTTVTVEVGPGAQSGDATGNARPDGDGGSPPQVPGDESCDGAREPVTGDNERDAEIAVRCLTNAVREQKGLPTLRFDERLARAAATRSNDMARLGYFAHQGPDGGNARRAVRRTGWVPSRASWLVGENIGWAPGDKATPAELMRSWLDSPTHRANILSEAFVEMGTGVVAAVPDEGAEPGATYTQIFGVTGAAARRAQTE